ncbi:hypothetical protein ACQPZG_05390 [Streptomyces sp. CA-294286]|uniref:hypothetical protein n=1 Tax=Streptomyces sp. CA-294286 TaxID=3240070 RepID=UPI003D8E099F
MTLLTVQTEGIPSKRLHYPGTEAETRHRRDARTGEAAPAARENELTHLLFDQSKRSTLHSGWRELISSPEFRHRPHLTEGEQLALSYERLRLLNSTVASPLQLANDLLRLASMHEWTGMVDGALSTLAGIHYNLFLGSLADHEAVEPRNLSAFTAMDCTGTFLCTELDHGNDAVSLRTTAEFDRASGEFILHTPDAGARKFMPKPASPAVPRAPSWLHAC